MSPNHLARLSRQSDATTNVFAAQGHGTRLSLVLILSAGTCRSIAQLTDGRTLTRQAISKHLRILEDAGVVHSRREGRKNLFALNPRAPDALRTYVEQIAEQSDASRARLKSLVER